MHAHSKCTRNGSGLGLSTVRFVAFGAAMEKSMRTPRGRLRHSTTPVHSPTRPSATSSALRLKRRGFAAARARNACSFSRKLATQGGGDHATLPMEDLRKEATLARHAARRSENLLTEILLGWRGLCM